MSLFIFTDWPENQESIEFSIQVLQASISFSKRIPSTIIKLLKIMLLKMNNTHLLMHFVFKFLKNQFELIVEVYLTTLNLMTRVSQKIFNLTILKCKPKINILLVANLHKNFSLMNFNALTLQKVNVMRHQLSKEVLPSSKIKTT